jgi:hypothetical protein
MLKLAPKKEKRTAGMRASTRRAKIADAAAALGRSGGVRNL